MEKKPVAPAPQEGLFAEKHAELLCEARDVARELGVAVRVVAFRPGPDDGGGTAVAHEFVGGVGREAVARDVSAMEPRELAAHRRQLRMTRAAVARELQARKAPGQQETLDGEDGDGAGSKRIATVD